jgi:CIC family chloride channel protein
MVIGGCIGGAIGLVLHGLFPEVVRQPACYVVVGMAGFFSGVAKTPISTLVMVSEMTGSYSLLLPSMWVCVLTFAMSKRWNLYSQQVATRQDSPAHQARFTVDVLRGIHVGEVLDVKREIRVLHESDHLKEAFAVVAASDQFPCSIPPGRWLE